MDEGSCDERCKSLVPHIIHYHLQFQNTWIFIPHVEVFSVKKWSEITISIQRWWNPTGFAPIWRNASPPPKKKNVPGFKDGDDQFFLFGQFIGGKNFRPKLPSLMKPDLVHVLSVVWATRSITRLRTPFEKRAHLCLLRLGRECPWPIIDASCTIPSNSVGSWPLLFRWVVPSSAT